MAQKQLTVAVTGPTGEIGISFIEALERHPDVARVRAMARRPFDPADHGWSKTDYRRGDILDRSAVDDLVTGADAVVHLAFIVVDASDGSEDINIEGSRTVFDATVAAGVPRLVYTSSVAAYGYGGVDGLLTEDLPTRGTEQHAYSRQKAAVEQVLAESLAGAESTRAWVFRPCIVAGPQAPALLNQLPYVQLDPWLPGPLKRALTALPGVRPVLPDHGVPFQLVHHDDVAAALVAVVVGDAEPGVYNLAADGEVTASDLARELGWHSVPVPGVGVTVAAKVLAHVPGFSSQAGWLEALRTPMLMDTSRARDQLGWTPAYDARQTLTALVAGRPARR